VRKVPAFFLGNATLIPRREWLEPIERLIDGADIRFFKTVPKGHARWIRLEDHPKHYGGCVVGLNVHRHPGITKECFNKRVAGRAKGTPMPQGFRLCDKMPEQEGTGFWNDGNYPAAHVNPRFMEMAACGTLVVSDDHRPELARLFPMAPRAESPTHFYELVRHYINHPDEAEAIGKRCSYLISTRHTYQHRACEVLIRAGLKDRVPADLLSFLGEPADWLTPQDFNAQGVRLSSAATGPSERWSPQYGLSLTRTSGSPSEQLSVDVPTPW